MSYEAHGDIQEFCHCHCSICRRLHGAAFVSWGGILRDGFRYLSGDDELRTYAFSPQADSLFCPNCGSAVVVNYKPEPHMLYLPLGSTDGVVQVPDGFHQFVASKAPWHQITDDLPQHADWPEESP